MTGRATSPVEPVASLLRRPSRPDPQDGSTLRLTAADCGWAYIGLEVHRLVAGQGFVRPPEDRELGLVVQEGVVTVQAGRDRFGSVGSRAGVFEGPAAPVILVAPGTEVEVRAEAPTTLVIASAPAGGDDVAGGRITPTRLIDVRSIRVEQRGAGDTARTVHHLLPPDEPAGRLILVEVFTPGGNWSSYPPHKHDTEQPPTESRLEELYHYRFARPHAFAFARVYTADRDLDQALTPEDGDVVLVPRGYHPVGMPAGYDGYYLNVMAGPSRLWRFTLDPDHAWLMDWDPARPR